MNQGTQKLMLALIGLCIILVTYASYNYKNSTDDYEISNEQYQALGIYKEQLNRRYYPNTPDSFYFGFDKEHAFLHKFYLTNSEMKEMMDHIELMMNDGKVTNIELENFNNAFNPLVQVSHDRREKELKEALTVKSFPKVKAPIEVQAVEIQLAKFERYLKVSDEEFKMIMASRVKKIGLTDNIYWKEFDNGYSKITYKNDDKVIAQTIESTNAIGETGIDFKQLNKDIKSLKQ